MEEVAVAAWVTLHQEGLRQPLHPEHLPPEEAVVEEVAVAVAAGGTVPQEQLHQGLRRSLHPEHLPLEEEAAAVVAAVAGAVRSAE